MKTKAAKILPIPVEDFDSTFDTNVTAIEGFSPLDYYQPIINQCSRFAIGPFYWFITDLATGTAVAVGGAIEQICSLKREEYLGQSPQVLFNKTHPVDITHMLAFSQYWINYISSIESQRRHVMRPTIYVRQMNSSNVFSWVMVQFIEPVVDDSNRLIHSLTFVTDISHIKSDNACFMTIFDASQNTSRLFICKEDRQVIEQKCSLAKVSPRELEVLKLIASGSSSKQISGELEISIKTVDNHRQNLLRKMSAKSSAELVNFAVKNGIV